MDEKKKSRTVQMTDDDWENVSKVASKMGLPPQRGRGRAIALMAEDTLKRIAKAEANA